MPIDKVISDFISKPFLSSDSSLRMRSCERAFSFCNSKISFFSFALRSSSWSRFRCSSKEVCFEDRFAASIAASKARLALERSSSALSLRDLIRLSMAALSSCNSFSSCMVNVLSFASRSSCDLSDCWSFERSLWQFSQSLDSSRRARSASSARRRHISTELASSPGPYPRSWPSNANGSMRKLTPNGLSTRLISGLREFSSSSNSSPSSASSFILSSATSGSAVFKMGDFFSLCFGEGNLTASPVCLVST